MLIKVEMELTEDFLSDVLVTAFDGNYGGCWYWARPADVENWLTTEKDVLDDTVIWKQVFIEDKEDEDSELWRVSHNVVAKGIKRILNGNVKCHDLIAADIFNAVIFNAVATRDAGGIDAEAADCIVQAGLFSDIVYG